MRPKETYTKEEYNALKRELLIMTDKYNHAQQQLDIARSYVTFIQGLDNGKRYNDIRQIIAEENKKREINELYIKYPYYKDLKDYVDMGITEVKQLASLTGKSISTIYRALDNMGLSLKKEDITKKGLTI